jgi:AcrR family transcriptional regulator
MTGIRARQKQATRVRILESARAQLLHRTFEDVGVREIAEGAGVAAGTVIASFGSKADVLEALMIEDYAIQYQQAIEASQGLETVSTRLLAMLAVGITYYADQPGLLKASLTATWGNAREASQRIFQSMRPIYATIAAELDAGKARGEVRADVDVKTGAHMVFECLVATHAVSIHGTGDTATMHRVLERRLGLLLRGMISSPQHRDPIRKAA